VQEILANAPDAVAMEAARASFNGPFSDDPASIQHHAASASFSAVDIFDGDEEVLSIVAPVTIVD